MTLETTGHNHVQVIGAPFNSAGTADGVARAPDALRRAELMAAINEEGVASDDRGDTTFLVSSAERDAVSHLIAPGAILPMIDAVAAQVADSLSQGAFPVVVGGDCPILLGCLAGAELTGESVGLMFVDGHEDAWSPALSRTGEAADMELGFILGLNHEGLPTDLSRSMPRLDGHAVAILGPRDQEELKEAGIPSLACRVALFHTARAVASHADALAISAARQLSRAGSWWLHVDLDVLSTESLSAVDYRQPGGLNWSDLRGLTEGALRSPAVVGWDITIYNPDLDVDGSGAEEIVAYVAAMLGKRQRWALAVRDDRRRTGPV